MVTQRAEARANNYLITPIFQDNYTSKEFAPTYCIYKPQNLASAAYYDLCYGVLLPSCSAHQPSFIACLELPNSVTLQMFF